MKLFIWDDYNWKLIEPTEEYNKNEYFIVRKLFVQWPKEVCVSVSLNTVVAFGVRSIILNSIRENFI